jgi:hypothetical protein
METGIAIAFTEAATAALSRAPQWPRGMAPKRPSRSGLSAIGLWIVRAANRPAPWTPRLKNYPY